VGYQKRKIILMENPPAILTLATATAADLERAGALVRADVEGMRRLAYYGEETAAWVADHGTQRIVLMLWMDESLVGFVDVETGADAVQAVMAYYIAAEYRGRGLAGQVLDLTRAWLAENTRVVVLLGYVEPDNRASVAALERAGFCREGTYRGMLTYRWTIYRR